MAAEPDPECRGVRALAVAVLWLALAVPCPIFAQTSGNPAAAVPDAPPAEGGVEVFDEVWSLVDRHFFDPEFRGVDWPAAKARHLPAARAATSPAELSLAINGLLGELATSHTTHFTPSQIAYYHLLDIFSRSRGLRREIDALFPAGVRYTGLGVFTSEIEGRSFVTGVWQGSTAERAGLLVGDELVAADGRPFQPVESFRGKAGEAVALSIRRRAGDPLETVVVEAEDIRPNRALLAAMRESVRVIERDGRRIGYVRIWSYAGREYQELLIDEMAEGRLKDADALLIDLRNGWGGASPHYLDPFLPGPEMRVRERREDEEIVGFKWRKPVGLLVDGGTRSGKEVLAWGFRAHGIGPVIGARTAGAVVAGRVFLLADDSLLYLAVADVTVDGRRLEGAGVEPTIPVPFDLRYSGGADPQLDRGLEEMARLSGGS